MDVIDADTTLSNIMSFMDPRSASETRRSERRMMAAMDSGKLCSWPEFAAGRTESPYEPYHVSAGLRSIIMRSSFSDRSCVSCAKSASDVPIHPFYSTVVCKRCRIDKIEYHIMGQKAACKKYFIKPADLGVEDVSRIERSQGVFSVLEHQVRSVAEKRLGKDVLRGRLEKRRRVANTVRSNRLCSYKRRLHLLTMHTKSALLRSRVRIDAYLMDIPELLRISGHYRLDDYIIHDVLDLRVNSRFSVESAAMGLFDFASFLSNCRRNGILMEDYVTACPHHDDFDVGIVFVDHSMGQMHFYEYISKYVKSVDSLLSRSRSVLAHTASMGDSLSKSSRRQVCEILFAEEGIPFTENEMVGQYIEYGTGDPVTIIREYRKLIFLYSNGYNDEVDYYMNFHRMCTCRASVFAKRGILLQTRGFPIMNRLFLDDRIPSRLT